MKKTVPPNAVLIPGSAERVFHGVIFDVYQWQQELFDGSHATFEMLRRPDTVVVMGVVGDKVLMINETQSHRGQRVDFPGGRVDAEDETVLGAAQRETLEETGFTFSHWRLATVYQPQHKIEWFVHVFIAWEGEKVAEPALDAGEQITATLVPLAEARQAGAGTADLLKGLLKNCRSAQDLLALPEFNGKEVEL